MCLQCCKILEFLYVTTVTLYILNRQPYYKHVVNNNLRFSQTTLIHPVFPQVSKEPLIMVISQTWKVLFFK